MESESFYNKEYAKPPKFWWLLVLLVITVIVSVICTTPYEQLLRIFD